ncbi:MAG: TRAP transporter substrate-binding protein [Desulfuromonadales bacterium]|nr:TRAP transporter substrate-binding protein [Desulfuromonadales bacterium]
MSRKFLGTWIVGMFLLLAVPTTVLAQQPIVLTFAQMNPETAYSSIHCVEPWARAVEEATGGKVKVQIYYGQTLAKGKDLWNSTKLGIADMAWMFHGFWPGMTPLADVVSLPALPFDTAEKGSGVFWKLYEKYPRMQKEFDDVKTLLVFTSEPYYLITRDKPVTKLEDLKGMKIRMTGGPPTDQMKALGGVPVLIPMPDTYLSMQKGVIDGMGASWEPIYGYRLYEVANHYTQTPFPAVYFSIGMNKNKWNSLPKDVQDAIMSVSGYEGSKFWGKNFWDIAKDATIARAKESGKEIKLNTLAPAELNRWIEIGGKPIWENWIKDMEKKGYPEAREVLQTLLTLSAEK